MTTIPTYIINLETRTDRKENVLSEFKGRDEFDIHLIKAQTHKIGVIGLWNTICSILQNDTANKEDFILICEDDHVFTENYSEDLLFKCINEAIRLNTDILCGGVSWFDCALRVSENCFSVNNFSGLQFTIIFKHSYKKILNTSISPLIAIDHKFSKISNRKSFIYPYISIQKEYGYSDVTSINNIAGRVTKLFADSSNRVKIIEKVYNFLKKNPINNIPDFNSISVPTYIINLPERTDRKEHILAQFKDKDEFDINVVDAVKHEVGAYGLWLSIRKVIQSAIKNDDDVIIICEDDHEFTEYYSRDIFLQNIFEAYFRKVDYLSVGAVKVSLPIPVTKNLFWVGHFLSNQFIVVFKRFFEQILNSEFDESIIVDNHLSRMAINKMMIYPFMSVQKNFGYSDISTLHKANPIIISRMFQNTSEYLRKLQEFYIEVSQ